jgi:propionyl-CoA carboxylase beta chain
VSRGVQGASVTSAQIADLAQRTHQSKNAGSPQARAKQLALGKKTARERIDLLLDPGSFHELDALVRHRSPEVGLAQRPYGDGVVTGHGTVDGRPVVVFAQDFTVLGGTLGEAYGQKVCKALDLAATIGCPIIGINDGAGGRIQEGVVAQALYGEIFYRNVQLSGVVPQISLIMGPCAGGAAYSPALTDFIVMVEQTSHMFVTGPEVLAAATGEHIDLEQLGGARTHSTRSGNAHYLATSEEEAISFTRKLLSYLPSSKRAKPPSLPSPVGIADEQKLESIIPNSASQPYDMRIIVQSILDNEKFLEVQKLFAKNILCGFGHLDGESVGIVASQPLHKAGCLDIDASEKAARFVRCCDAFGIPVITFVDVPGFLPGLNQEWNGIIRRGAKLLYAYAEATTPTVTVITRKAYGGAYVVLGSKHLRSDFSFAWPTAQIAVMGASGAVNILYRRELAQAENPDAIRAKLITEYEDLHNTPYRAAERGYVDAVIAPSQTRRQLMAALRILRTKDRSAAKQHGNMPM